MDKFGRITGIILGFVAALVFYGIVMLTYAALATFYNPPADSAERFSKSFNRITVSNTAAKGDRLDLDK